MFLAVSKNPPGVPTDEGGTFSNEDALPISRCEPTNLIFSFLLKPPWTLHLPLHPSSLRNYKDGTKGDEGRLPVVLRRTSRPSPVLRLPPLRCSLVHSDIVLVYYLNLSPDQRLGGMLKSHRNHRTPRTRGVVLNGSRTSHPSPPVYVSSWVYLRSFLWSHCNKDSSPLCVGALLWGPVPTSPRRQDVSPTSRTTLPGTLP